jgi:5-methylcytosine-specific restriction enzyme subunit McrC
MPVRPTDCDEVKYTRLNESYRSRINLARLIIRNLSLEGLAGSTQFASYLFDMSDVFELFVARFLRDHFAGDPSTQVEIQKSIWLDEDQKEVGIPDIILRRDGRRYLVLDTKYKVFEQKPTAADRNQMFVYCHTLGLKRGILVYANDQDVNYSRPFKGATLSAQALPLHGNLDEFRARCRRFADGFVEAVAAGREA